MYVEQSLSFHQKNKNKNKMKSYNEFQNKQVSQQSLIIPNATSNRPTKQVREGGGGSYRY
jgi:hypothetical protein